MKSPLAVGLAALALSSPLFAQAQQRIELINDPVADGLFDEDGVLGYQYIYDVYISSGGAGAFQLGGEKGPLGAAGTFEGDKSAWYRVAPNDASFHGVWQVWYSSSTGNSCGLFGCEGDDYNDPAAYGHVPGGTWSTAVFHHDGSSGVGPLFPPGPVPWARDNTWHLPAKYGPTSEYFFPGPGFGADTTADKGLAWSTVTGIFVGGPVRLQATVRVVAPFEPGFINWYIDAPISGMVRGPNGPPVELPPLSADINDVSIAAGGVQTLDIDAGAAFGGDFHLILGSASGTTPGVVIDGFPIPLNVDSYTFAVLNDPNAPPFTNGFGVLDAAGKGQTLITIPGATLPVSVVGLTLHHAVVLLDFIPLPGITLVTNAQPLTFAL